MRTHLVLKRGSARLLVAALVALSACKGARDAARDSASGAVDSTTALRDTTVLRETGATRAIGPLVEVTKTDSRSVRDATGFQVTEANLAKFVQASESLAVLRARDPEVRKLGERYLAEAGSTESDAGLKLLESNKAVSDAITASGLSVRDYYVMAIALASAERFIDDPSAAPPTPSSEKNANFLRQHTAELARLRELTRGPVV
jgi:hypothetical protein